MSGAVTVGIMRLPNPSSVHLKKEQIKRRIYNNREEARSDIFEYIEVFYNRRRRQSHLGQLSPADYEEKANLNEVNECLSIRGSHSADVKGCQSALLLLVACFVAAGIVSPALLTQLGDICLSGFVYLSVPVLCGSGLVFLALLSAWFTLRVLGAFHNR